VFVIRRQQGRLAELGLLGSSPPTSLQPMAWIAARAVAAIDLGEPAIAANALDELKAMPLPTNLIRPSVVAAMAEAAWFLGDRDASSRVRDDLEARSGTLITIPGAAAALGAADRFIAMLHLLDGDSEAAAAAFDRAERLERNVGAHHLAADTQRCRQAIVS
jgi:hypothetical protein